MIKRILVALDGSQHANAALDYALWLADRLRAGLFGVHVIDIVSLEGSFLHDLSGSLGFEPYLAVSTKLREALQQRGRLLLETFRERCAARGVACDDALPVGVIANELCDRARTADLVVVGQRGTNEQFSTGLLGSTTESVTRKSPKPVLVCPAAFQPITSPLLAYDGSERASAAMHAAADVASALGLPLRVVHAARDGGAGAAEDRALDEARRYLATYELAVTYDAVPGPAHERIVAEVQRGAHDLLFIGAYGHSRVIELVLGSTTEFVLRNSRCPVFLAR